MKKIVEYLQIIVEALIFTAKQDIPWGNNAETAFTLVKYQMQTVLNV